MAMRGSWTVLMVAPLLLLATEGSAWAQASMGPIVHTDRYGRRLLDLCPDRGTGERRCHLHRVLSDGDPEPLFCDTCMPCGPVGSTNPPTGSMAPSDIIAAYNIPSTARAYGAIVALVDLPSVNAMKNVNTYRSFYKIPTLPACPVNGAGVPTPALASSVDGGAEGGAPAGAKIPCFARVGQDGTVNTVSASDCGGGPSQESSLDIEMVSAVCPDCSIVLVEASTAGGSLDQMSLIAAPPATSGPCTGGVLGASVVSTSWGGPEYPGADEHWFACPNILTLASAGDAAYLLEDYGGALAADWPAASQYVIGVGGTTLGPFTETVWDDDITGGGGMGYTTSSGCSSYQPMPAYQSTSGFDFGTCKRRAANDVSAPAEWGSGAIAVYDYDTGGWSANIGTSASSPIAAGIFAVTGLGGKDQHALFYKNGGAFYDITTGNDDPKGKCTAADHSLCYAGPEWDGPTGLGSLASVPKLIALAGGKLEPEPDAGVDSGPTPDAGKDSGGGTMDSGADSGSDAGKKPSKHGIGAPCTQSFQCSGSDQCVSPGGSKPTVCAPICDTSTPCPSGYSCQSGFCFTGSAPADAGTGNKTQPTSSSGCGCSTAPARFSWATAGWLALGLLGLARRRKK